MRQDALLEPDEGRRLTATATTFASLDQAVEAYALFDRQASGKGVFVL